MKKIKIGIVVKKYNNLATKYNYGLEQNTYYLVELLKSIPEYDVSYVICEEGVLEESLKNRQEMGDDTAIVEKKSLNPKLKNHIIYDVLIHIECFIDENLIRKIKRHHATKFVDFHAGIVMWGLMEDMIYDVQNRFSGAVLKRKKGLIDAIWTSPHHHYHKTYLETIAKTPTTIIPYLYEPWFLQKIEAAHKKTNPNFNCYYDQNNKKNIGILEPNINLVKNCVIPLAIVENLYDQGPEKFNDKNVRLYCSDHIANRQAFNHLYSHLTCQTILSSEKRYKISDILNSDCDVIISHQHLCELNYLYLDALYYEIPLVHNSPLFKEFGYYYPDFDVQKGGNALSQALNKHNDNIDSYREKSKEALYKFSTKNPDNINGYKKIINRLIDKN